MSLVPRRVRKRPVVIEVVEYRADGSNRDEVVRWCDEVGAGFNESGPSGSSSGTVSAEGRASTAAPTGLWVWHSQDDQWLQVPRGHYVARGLHGELYPLSPEALASGYEDAQHAEADALGNVAVDCEPNLGCATTRQIVGELRARADTGSLGEGDLRDGARLALFGLEALVDQHPALAEYRTVDG